MRPIEAACKAVADRATALDTYKAQHTVVHAQALAILNIKVLVLVVFFLKGVLVVLDHATSN